MAKRKIETSEGLPTAPKRRSSRQKTAIKDESLSSEISTAKRSQIGKKPPKPRKGDDAREETAKERDLSTFQPSRDPQSHRYWLMKAEPESRLEKGHDIKFSIDDLAAKKDPEPWDGIRAYPARNNLRAMKKGDLAFFYHSSCKVPAIVGIMEIVKEHTPDFSAQDANTPYYDAKDLDISNPKWSVVHVEFRRKLKEPITLKVLRQFAAKGGPLENMQMLRQSRLSVSEVSKEEWDFLVGIMDKGEGIDS